MVFKKGQSGNPNGRPRKEFTISDLLRTKLEEEVEVVDKQTRKKQRIKNSDLVVDRILGAVRKGEKWAIELLLDRIEGKPQQRIEQTTEIEGSLEMTQRPSIVFSTDIVTPAENETE
jgi:hypothetical protein